MLVPSLDAVARGGALAYRIHPIGADLQKMRRGSEAVERLMRVNGAEWNDDMISVLRAMWDEGHSTRIISERIGVSRNAVIGKARRLHLARRESPINFGGVTKQPRWRAVPKPPKATLPVLHSLPHVPVFRLQPQQVAAFGRRPPEPRRGKQPALLSPTGMVSHQFPPERKCCFPIGQPRAKGFRFCCSRVTTPGPYCDAHRKTCYVGMRWHEPDDNGPGVVFLAGKRVVTAEGRRRISEGVKARNAAL